MMELQTLLDHIMSANRLETIAQARDEMRAYIAAHPAETQNRAHPIYTAARSLYSVEAALNDIAAHGIPLEEYCSLRDHRNHELDAGQDPTPWPDEWLPVLYEPLGTPPVSASKKQTN